jgi:DNA-binding transcriptional LysR family regulator
MTLSDIETFLAIADGRSITQAADVLFVSQSTVSHRLKKLEDTLGVNLILRGKGFRNVELTQKGEEFIPLARQWKTLWQNTYNFKLANTDSSLSIAGPDSINAHLLVPFYNQLSNMNNPINLQVRTMPSSEIYTSINNNEIDIGFVFHQSRYKDIICKPIFRESIYMVCKAGSHYDTGPIHPNKLDPKNEILLPWGVDFQRWHDIWWNPRINPHVCVDNVTLLLNLMNNTRYWAACPESVICSLKDNPDIEIHRFSVSPPSRTCYMLEQRNPKQSKAIIIDAFKAHLETFLAKSGFTV